MSHLDTAFKTLCDYPTIDVLTCFAAQLEMLAPRTPAEEMKPYMINVMRTILREPKFEHIREDEVILRVYKVLGSVSQKLGATGVYEQIEKIGYFTNSLKFHLQWAEEYGKSKNLTMFGKVLDLARKRLKDTMPNAKIEAGFRDLAEQYFKEDVDYLFLDRDETLNLFDPRFTGKTKNRRRSSVCMLRRACPVENPGNQNLFGPKTKTLIRREIVEGISCEEFCVALVNDVAGDEMDIQGDSIYIEQKSPEEVQNPKIENRRRQLSMVAEEKNTSDEADAEKRSRIFSPVVPTKDAHRIPLRNSSIINEQPQTITLSSDTKVSQLENQTFEDEKVDEKLKEMELGRKERYSSESERSTRTAKSDNGLDILAENNCLEAHAAFSDTVHIARERTMVIDDHSMMEEMRSLAPTQNATDYSVYCDPTFVVQPPTTIPVAPSNRSSGLNIRESHEPAEEELPKETEEEKIVKNEDPSFNTPPVKNGKQFFDDTMFSGFQSTGKILTSTPANHVPFIHMEEYFGNSQNIDRPPKEPVEEPQFLIPDVKGTLQNRLNRRKSVAPPTIVPEQLVEQKPSFPKPSMEESLSEQLGRRLSLGTEELANKLVEATPIEEETGRKDRRRSEVIRQENNPWDVNLRIRLMKCVHTPINMHEFETNSPKILAMKSFEAGGEKYNIQTLVGQGGYAKVYKAVNEEKKLVAVKYEIPSCAWEVYICDQIKTRLSKKKDESSNTVLNHCIMQVTDAYIFTNASLLVNEYHEYGSLLDNINNSKDPNWHISCFLLVQLAKIIQKVHECQIVHGDIKPDNFMITRKIDLNWEADKLMGNDVFVVKLIDWGRAIDMEKLSGREFKGRAGTEGFDCPEMIDGRGWTYQPDFFGFAATMAVLICGAYSKMSRSETSYSLDVDIKRRNKLREPAMEIIKEFLNIPSCTQLPKWSKSIDMLEEVWNSNFDISAWRQAATKFNDACEKFKK